MMAPSPHCGERDFCRCSRKFLDIVSFTIRIWRHALTIVFARSKTDYIQSSPSADQSVNWSIQPVTKVAMPAQLNFQVKLLKYLTEPIKLKYK